MNLLEKGALAATPISAVGALNGRGTRIFEGFLATQHIVHFFSLQVHFALKLLLYPVNVRTCAAKEAHVVT